MYPPPPQISRGAATAATVTATATATATALSTHSPPKFRHPIPPLFSHRRPYFLSTPTPTPSLTTLIVNAADPSNISSKPDDQPISLLPQQNLPLEGVIQFEKPNSNSRFKKWGHVALLSGGDVLAILLFSAIGRFSHGLSVFDAETVRTADPFIAGWFLSAYFVGGYGDDGRGMNGRTNAITAALKSWALGIPLGIVIRAASVGHIPPTRFIAVTMGSTALLLIGWRALLSTILAAADDNTKKSDIYKRGTPFELFELLTSLVRRW